MKIFTISIALITILISSHTVLGQGFKLSGFNFVSENDFFFPPKNNDDNYTGQFKFEFFFNNSLKSNELYSAYLNALAYTPPRELFSATNVVKEARPYASLLELGIMKAKWFENGDAFLTNNFFYSIDFSGGLFGDDFVGKGQNFIHTYITVNSDSVKGWHNQIGNPGKFVFNIRGTAIKQFIHSGEISIAGKVDLNTGLFMNFLEFGFPIGNVPISGIHHNSSIIALFGGGKRKVRLFYETYPSIRLVGQNSTLTGYLINDNSPYVIGDEDINRLIFKSSNMLVLHIPYGNRMDLDERKFVNLVYKANVRSKEFSKGESYHLYGTISLQIFW